MPAYPEEIYRQVIKSLLAESSDETVMNRLLYLENMVTELLNEKGNKMTSVFKKPEPIKQARQYLIDIYLDWLNNYLTVDKFALDHGLTYGQAVDLISIANAVYNSDHPES